MVYAWDTLVKTSKRVSIVEIIFHVNYNSAKAYSLKKFNGHFQYFKNKCPTIVPCLEELNLQHKAGPIFQPTDMM